MWRCILANPVQTDSKAFFSADHNNLLTGAKASLDIPGLTEAEIKFSEQERSEGRPLGIPAKILLVPASLKVAAETLMKSLTVNETTETNKPKPVINPHAGKYETVSTPYLSSKAFKGNSDASRWPTKNQHKTFFPPSCTRRKNAVDWNSVVFLHPIRRLTIDSKKANKI